MRLLLPLLFVIVSCGPRVAPNGAGAGLPGGAVKMRHQIMVTYGGDVQVFEGFMILQGDSFVVQAFAGPGIDLFTVARKGAAHREEAHIKALEERLDLEAVGADIARVYLPVCPEMSSTSAGGCAFLGEPFEEERRDGVVVKRAFPEAHGIGLTISMNDHEMLLGEMRPKTVEIAWGNGENRMVIKLLTIEPFEGNLDALLGL